jgi:ubiquinol-cytochrome c reductase iron-sulfur subunit
MTDLVEPGHSASSDTRRDFLVVLATAVATIGGACAIWPLLDSMEPSADVLAMGGPVDVDVSHIAAGQQIVVTWRSRPVFIVRRTPDELKMLQATQDTSQLRDPNSDAFQQPGYAKNWHRSIKPEILVLVGICTHLGCIPRFEPNLNEAAPGWVGGYFCPCHGSKYDLSGRVYTGVPAPYNLPVPPHNFVSDTLVRIGENPAGAKFDFESIEQI